MRKVMFIMATSTNRGFSLECGHCLTVSLFHPPFKSAEDFEPKFCQECFDLARKEVK